MICCKIITDYNKENTSFQGLLESLGILGDLRWENGTLFFADTTGNTTEHKIIRILKKNGYLKSYLDIYSKENPPRETDDSVNSWLLTKLTAICYKEFEDSSQEKFKQISEGLDILDQQLDLIIESQKENKHESKEDD